MDRLAEDHRNAKRLAEGLAKIEGIRIDLQSVQTNIVLFDISDLGNVTEDFIKELQNQGVLAGTLAKNKIRLVTHRGIETEHINTALSAVSATVSRFQQ